MNRRFAAVAVLALAGLVTLGIGQPPTSAPASAELVVDLTTAEGLKSVGAQWRVGEAKIVDAEGKTKEGKAVPTHDISPHAGAADFDDSAWDVPPADNIRKPLGGGKLSFEWFRIKMTVPEKVGE